MHSQELSLPAGPIASSKIKGSFVEGNGTMANLYLIAEPFLCPRCQYGVWVVRCALASEWRADGQRVADRGAKCVLRCVRTMGCGWIATSQAHSHHRAF